ncbi:hypothetical protein EV702DRAFT_1205452 [Suillus placidus]|uniref:Uncharacterized protein n=1 Tax=Suillus placidus TaxID=48579 RepID=A0A9P7CWG3_9AGAM|nr:hypothetical protein EV702DRAFT_1205452 [Suillus placidus]
MTQSTSGSASSFLAQVQSFSDGQKRVPTSQIREITLAEVHGDLDFWRWINDLEDFVDPVLPTSELPSSQVREITLAEVHGDLDFWRWINDLEDFVDPVLPISELPSSQSPETMLTEAAEDPDVWRLVNEIEDFADPELPLCEFPADAAEDPDFCNFPLRTLLICSWLDNSYGSAPR